MKRVGPETERTYLSSVVDVRYVVLDLETESVRQCQAAFHSSKPPLTPNCRSM